MKSYGNGEHGDKVVLGNKKDGGNGAEQDKTEQATEASSSRRLIYYECSAANRLVEVTFLSHLVAPFLYSILGFGVSHLQFAADRPVDTQWPRTL